jgi:hypothetical protein
VRSRGVTTSGTWLTATVDAAGWASSSVIRSSRDTASSHAWSTRSSVAS